MNEQPEGELRTRMPADVDAPDKVLYGLTFRQLAILAVGAVVLFAGWRRLHTLLPVPVLLAVMVPLGVLVFIVAVGRRDGLPLDQWLTHAVRHRQAPKALSTSDAPTPVPDWVDKPAARDRKSVV